MPPLDLSLYIGATGRCRYEDHFRKGPCLFLVFCVKNWRCSRNGSRLCPDFWIQKKSNWLGQSSQKFTLCPTELIRQFLCHLAFYLLWHLSDIILVTSKNDCVSWLAVPSVFFLTFSSNCCQLSHVSECCRFEGGIAKRCLRLIYFSIFSSNLGKQNWVILSIILRLVKSVQLTLMTVIALVSQLYTSFLAGIITVYSPSQATN